VTIPRDSLMRQASGQTVVCVVEQDTLRLRPVETGMESDGFVEVGGLEPGERVVTSTFLGWANLCEGLKVEVAE
jgi:multidrug efflux pump subunit AcrA (membrane-fusion protein)